jgi:hypothetical protein
MQNLADGIVGGSVNIPGGVGVSTEQKRFVQFSAKLDCPTPPVTPPKTPENPKNTPSTPVHTPAAIPSTGPAEIVSGFTGVTALGYGIRRYLESRNILK